jgi:GTPase SAR1 family protein
VCVCFLYCLQVDILDTCGNPQFPAMRRLSIANANAFMFVYSIDCERSFETVKRNFEEVREQREDYQMLPIVIAGNKLDLPSEHRRVTVEDASEWLYCELPKMRQVPIYSTLCSAFLLTQGIYYYYYYYYK